MNGPLALEIAKIFGALVGLLTGAYVTYWRVREKKRVAELELEPNPERCGSHAARLDGLEGRVAELEKNNREDHKTLGNQIGAVGTEVTKLGVLIQKN